MKTNNIVCNRISTPDGTVLTSTTVHDYRTYTDTKDGREYMVDGGSAYLRRNKGDYIELSVYDDDPHEEVRKVFTWGTYGPNGDRPLTRVALEHLSLDHINNILNNCNHIHEWMIDIFNREVDYRGDLEDETTCVGAGC